MAIRAKNFLPAIQAAQAEAARKEKEAKFKESEAERMAPNKRARTLLTEGMDLDSEPITKSRRTLMGR